ncbi:MAG: hypothetical protein ABG776_08380 [Cyanobacteria bacterium J06555_13]
MRLKARLVACGIALSLPLIVGVYQVWPRAENSAWQSVASVAPPGLMMQIARDNLAPGFDEQVGQMKMMRPWQSGQVKALYLIDSRTADLSTQENSLCGALGCAFFGYVPTDAGEQNESFQSVLSLYLDPSLPPEIPLIEVTNTLFNDMPELVIHQLEDDQLIQMRLVLSNEQYEVVETQYLSSDRNG